MLVLTRKPNQAIMIGRNIRILVVEVDCNQVKLGIEAPRNVAVHRYEIFEEINRATKSTCGTVGKASAEGDTTDDADVE